MFIGLGVWKLLVDGYFTEKLNSTKLDACKLSKQEVKNFLGRYIAENFVEMIENLLQAYHCVAAESH